jgi:hypothetical protein
MPQYQFEREGLISDQPLSPFSESLDHDLPPSRKLSFKALHKISIFHGESRFGAVRDSICGNQQKAGKGALPLKCRGIEESVRAA